MSDSEPKKRKFDVKETKQPFFADMLQIENVEVGPTGASLELTVKERHLRTLGMVHGGVTASLLDSVMGIGVGASAPPNHFTVTIQLNVNFIRPARFGEKLLAKSEIQHKGRRTAVARGEIYSADGVLIGTGTGTFLYVEHDESTRAWQRDQGKTTS